MIVDDSVFVRGILKTWLSEDPEFAVVATHANGRLAVNDVVAAQPDVVILDLEMPDMDGLQALPIILERKPNTMVVVASTLTRRGAEVSLRALTLGAADYLPKPDAGRGIAAADDFKRELLAKVRSLGQRARRRPGLARPSASAPAAAAPPAPTASEGARATATAARPATPAPPPPVAAPLKRGETRMRSYSMSPVGILTIGSSTGGPQALTRLFGQIGQAVGTVPVVIAQHMPATFTAILAEHVSRAAGRPAAEGVDGEELVPGRIYIAPGGRHMVVERVKGKPGIIRLNDDPPVNFCRPAVDPLFNAVAQGFGSHTLALVLTGMGSDGARGAGVIADAGGSVIVQDEETSVVWGMPGATASAGNACEILPLDGIARKVNRLLTGARS
ncbi:chemotaxis response regulator protein-glutamate methylesterase [Aquabacter sp. L1I39]|uniref:protein-glutamate methylesterase/protein-glutamine glutaminase n=1 Tax=Aquabacter sp. L1I39 TaxID=2820278 RepID=UPI001ADBA631|nr:chemotaxis response regulator protein-glutamate methylesterase [Aquabacter sp. L1I39]QTL06001.1 chemotaxis response regulator protein-glutamate methylesterase [Aquabacter sp. L1I39]